MAIRFLCNCGHKLTAHDEQAGQRGKCPACGAAVVVPTIAAPNDALPTRRPVVPPRTRSPNKTDPVHQTVSASAERRQQGGRTPAWVWAVAALGGMVPAVLLVAIILKSSEGRPDASAPGSLAADAKFTHSSVPTEKGPRQSTRSPERAPDRENPSGDQDGKPEKSEPSIKPAAASPKKEEQARPVPPAEGPQDDLSDIESLRKLDAKLQTNEQSRVVKVDLSRTNATDESLKKLGSFEALTDLDVSYTKITDRAFQHIVKLRNLERLNLAGNPSELDAEEAFLAALEGKVGPGITIMGISRLHDAKLPHLKELNIEGLGFGVNHDAWKKAYPDCKLVENSPDPSSTAPSDGPIASDSPAPDIGKPNEPDRAATKKSGAKEVSGNQRSPLETASKTKSSRPERLVRNAGSLTKQAIDRWESVTEEVSGYPIDRGELFFFLTDFDRLYDEHGFRQSESETLLKRMKIVPKDEVEAWRDALSDVVTGDIVAPWDDDEGALLVIVQQDVLFQSDVFDRPKSKTLRERVASIPYEVIDTAADVELLGNDSCMDQATAATALASYDPLFSNHRFQEGVWQKMLIQHRARTSGKE